MSVLLVTMYAIAPTHLQANLKQTSMSDDEFISQTSRVPSRRMYCHHPAAAGWDRWWWLRTFSTYWIRTRGKVRRLPLQLSATVSCGGQKDEKTKKGKQTSGRRGRERGRWTTQHILDTTTLSANGFELCRWKSCLIITKQQKMVPFCTGVLPLFFVIIISFSSATPATVARNRQNSSSLVRDFLFGGCCYVSTRLCDGFPIFSLISSSTLFLFNYFLCFSVLHLPFLFLLLLRFLNKHNKKEGKNKTESAKSPTSSWIKLAGGWYRIYIFNWCNSRLIDEYAKCELFISWHVPWMRFYFFLPIKRAGSGWCVNEEMKK